MQALCDAGSGWGATWNQDGVIVYGTQNAGLWRVPAHGGTPAQLSAPNGAYTEFNHRWPVFLPGGSHYVYTVLGTADTAGIYLGAMESKERTKLTGDRSSSGYAEGPEGEGYLMVVRGTTLMAQRFDAGKRSLAGESFPIAENVGVEFGGQAVFSVSGNGMLVYGAGWGRQTRLTWMDRAGKRLESLGDLGDLMQPTLLPDAK